MLFTSAASSDMNIPKGLAAIAATIITTIRTTKRIATPTQPKAAKNAAAAFVTAATIAFPIAATAFAVFIAATKTVDSFRQALRQILT